MARVLLVEANKEVRQMYQTVVENAGFDVTTSIDAREARAELAKNKFSAVIINSPKQEVLWFLGVVRASHSIPIATLPILVVLDDPTEKAGEYIEAGASKALAKFPSSGEKLIEQLRSILNIPKLQLKT